MSCWDANLSHFRLYSIIIILIFRDPKPLFPLTVLLTLLTRVVLYISWLLIAYFSAHFYHYKDSRLTVTSPRPKLCWLLLSFYPKPGRQWSIWLVSGGQKGCICWFGWPKQIVFATIWFDFSAEPVAWRLN